MKMPHIILICICAGFPFTLAADEFANTDDSSHAADLTQQAKADLQDASTPQDYRAAAKLLDKAVALNPDNLDAQETLGWVYLDQLHEPRKAYPHLEILARGRAGDVNARKLFGMACLQTGRSQKAVEEFHAAAELKPDDLWIRAHLARALAQTGKWSEAMAIYNEILKVDPQNADARFGEAQIEAWEGYNVAPMRILNQLINENPDNIEALELRADLRRWNWGLTGAEQDYREVLTNYPDNTEARSGLQAAHRAWAPDVTATAYQFKDTTHFLREYLEADARLPIIDHAYLVGDVAGWRFTNPGFLNLNRGDASAGMEFDLTRWLQVTAQGDVFDYENRPAVYGGPFTFYGGHFSTKISLTPTTEVYLTGALQQPYVWSMLTVEEAMRQNSVGAGLDTKLVGRLSFQVQSQGATLSDHNSWWEVTPQLSYCLINKLQTFIRVQYDYLNYAETRTNYWTPQQRYTLGPVLDTSIPLSRHFHLVGDAKAPYIFDEHKFGYELEAGPQVDLFNHVTAKATYYYSHIPGSQGEWSGQGWLASLQISF